MVSFFTHNLMSFSHAIGNLFLVKSVILKNSLQSIKSNAVIMSLDNSLCSSFGNELTIIKNQYIAPPSLYNFQFVKPSIPYFLLKEYSLHEILA